MSWLIELLIDFFKLTLFIIEHFIFAVLNLYFIHLFISVKIHVNRCPSRSGFEVRFILFYFIDSGLELETIHILFKALLVSIMGL